MKNLKIILENGRTHVMLNTTEEKAIAHAKDVRFNGHKELFKIKEATKKEVENEKLRLQKNKDEFESVTNYNNKISRYNSAVAKATNHHEFMNAAKNLK